MSKAQEQDQLIKVLQFTPRQICITLHGYGGEIVMGRVSQSVYEYWQDRCDDLEEYATDWSDNETETVPEKYQPFARGAWHDCDDIAHNNGIELSGLCWITVEDQSTGETLFSTTLDHENLENHGVKLEEFENIELDDFESGTCVFVGQSVDKGCFFSAEFELTQPWDPAQLQIRYSVYNSWPIVDSVSYAGEDLDGADAYDTRGKSANYEIYRVGSDAVDVLEGEETWAQRVIDQDDRTEWLPGTCDPVHLGVYECSINDTVEFVRWDGERWINCNSAVDRWRGLKQPVDQ
jgi:hypothetical protein